MKNKLVIRSHNFADIMTEPREKSKQGELSKGAKTAVEAIFSENELGIQKIKQMTLEIEKGLLCEEQAINTVSRRIGRPLVKNMIEKTDEFGTGMIDTRFGNKCIFDIKCSYSLETFPMFEEDNGKFLPSKYIWQMKRYLMLWNIPHGYVAYVLESESSFYSAVSPRPHCFGNLVFYKFRNVLRLY